MISFFLTAALALLGVFVWLTAGWFTPIFHANLPVSGLAWFLIAIAFLFIVHSFLRTRRAHQSGAIKQQEDSKTPPKLLEEASVPAAILQEGRLVRVNSAFCSYLGIKRRFGEIAGISFAAFVHPLDVKRFEALTAPPLPHSTEPPPLLRLRRVDGALLDTRIKARSVTQQSGEVILLELSGVNPAEQSVHYPFDDEDKCRSVIANMTDIAFQLDGDGRWVFLNPAWEKLTGFAVADSLGKPYLNYVHPDEKVRNKEKFDCLIQGTGGCWYETRLLMADGGFRWVEVRATRVASVDGNVSGTTGTLTDITKRRLAEESLNASKRVVTTLLANLPGLAYRGQLARDWRMEFLSDGCFELTGYEACDLINNLTMSYVELIHPEDRDYVWRQVQCDLPHKKGFELEYRIITRSGEIKWVWEQARGVYSAAGDLLALEGFVSDITARKRAEDEARRNLVCDELTGAYNRNTLQAWLEYLYRHSHVVGYSFAVLCLDLDDFAKINKIHGHATGDRLLAEVGRRIKGMNSNCNVTARLGSDEFAILITDLNRPPRLQHSKSVTQGSADLTGSDKHDAAQIEEKLALLIAQIAGRLQEGLSEPIVLDGYAFKVTASIGIAVSVSNYNNPDTMLREAIEAAHRAKFLGPSRYMFADQALYGKALGRRQVESILRGAFGSHALEVCYQPVIDLSSGELAWLEPTVYWLHPRRGGFELLDTFQTIAAETGLLVPITRWVLREVCRHARSWESQLKGRAPRTLCLSLLGSTLSDNSIITEIERALKETAFEVSQCVIYVKEVGAIVDSVAAQQALITLKERGARIIVDHDPKAPAGPLNLVSVAADIWKIDVRQAQNGNRLSDIRSVSAETRTQATPIIATGISTEELLAVAKHSGFVYGEGSFLSEPVSAASVVSLIHGELRQAS
jgi:PAS domain S-box-containing protein/diguanylate cyclase (GGDEF)-like protein